MIGVYISSYDSSFASQEICYIFRIRDFCLKKKHLPSPHYFSGRITTVHNDSGLRGTWSWNSSNFHSDDVMDSSYNDPNFVPVYSLDGISDEIGEV